MWIRRRFLENLSALPVVGGFVAASPSPAEAARNGNRDYFRDLGVRPFINAAGTYTAMTASLMPPVAIGFTISVFSTFGHEAIGHGAACVLTGCDPVQFSSTYFHALGRRDADGRGGADPRRGRRRRWHPSPRQRAHGSGRLLARGRLNGAVVAVRTDSRRSR